MDINQIKKIVKLLEQYQPAYFVITAGLYETAKFKYIDMKNGKYWDYSKEIKKITNTPIVTQGGITDLFLADRLIKEKYGDLVGMAQALIADPGLIKKTFLNNQSRIVPCIAHLKVGACHRCRYLKQKDKTFSCITPTSWKPNKKYLSMNKIKKDLNFWKKINKEVYC